ncbi:MAG: universal stress protein [Treponema sp.]|nr:universal stress protein [Treponema sp.]
MAKEFLKKALVAINGSESSIRAAMYGIMMARTYKLELKFLYVIDSATITYLGMNQMLAKDEQIDYKVDLAYEGQNHLEYVASLAASKGVTAQTELKDGSVVTEILKSAKDFEADLILIGSTSKKKGASLIKRNVHSTHQNDIIENARIPVLVVQSQDKDSIETKFKLF